MEVRETQNPQIAVRRLIPDQWGDYRTLRLAMLDTDPDAFPPQAFADREKTEDDWRRNIKEGIILVSYDGEKPVGMVRGTFDAEKAIARNMYTDTAYRGLGIGKKLMSGLLDEITAEGRASIVELEVEDSQIPARKMYGQYGFVEVGRVPEGDKFMITMQKSLRPQ